MNKSYQESGNKFIDHSHDDLFGFMDTMTFFVRDEWDVDSFKSLANDFIDQLENHFSREAIILKCADFQYLDERIINHRELALQVRIRIMDICDRDDAVKFLMVTRSRIVSHEFVEDQSYWFLFEDESFHKIFPWSKEYETLLIDLDNLISEIRKKETKTNNVGEYLKCWFLNYIQNFDIPTFKVNRN